MPPKFAPSGPLLLVMKNVMFGNCGGGACATATPIHASGATRTVSKRILLGIPSSLGVPAPGPRANEREWRAHQSIVASQNCVQKFHPPFPIPRPTAISGQSHRAPELQPATATD